MRCVAQLSILYTNNEITMPYSTKNTQTHHVSLLFNQLNPTSQSSSLVSRYVNACVLLRDHSWLNRVLYSLRPICCCPAVSVTLFTKHYSSYGQNHHQHMMHNSDENFACFQGHCNVCSAESRTTRDAICTVDRHGGGHACMVMWSHSRLVPYVATGSDKFTCVFT